MADRSNWPLLWCQADFATSPNVAGATVAGVASDVTVWDDLSDRLKDASGSTVFSTALGRQYELGAVETGTASVALANQDEALTPANTASAYNVAPKALVPYRPLRIGAAYPRTGNFFRYPWVLVSDSSDFEGSIGGWAAAGTTVPTIALSSTRAHDGTKSMLVTWPTASAGVAKVTHRMPLTVAGETYTLSAWVYVASGPAVRLTYRGLNSTSSSGTGSWQRLTLTWTETTGATDRTITLAATGATTAGQQVWVDSVQLELASAATAYTSTAPGCYPLHTGYVERYPTTWSHAGRHGWTRLESVDALALWSQMELRDLLTAQALADGAVALWPLADESTSSWDQVADTAVPDLVKVEDGDPTSTAVAAQGASWGPDATPAPLLTPTSASDSVYLYADLADAGAALTDAGLGLSIEAWARNDDQSAGTVFVAMADNQTDWLKLRQLATGAWEATATVGGATAWTITTDAMDPGMVGQWRHWMVTEASDGSSVLSQLLMDGIVVGSSTRAGAAAVQVASIYVGGSNDSTTREPFRGAVSRVALYATAYDSALDDWAWQHYVAGVLGLRGDLAGVRVARILEWAGWHGPAAIDSGTASIGSAAGMEGRGLTELLAEVTAAENGALWVASDGTAIFSARSDRSTPGAAVWVFGEDTAAGEIPYQTDVGLSLDPSYLANDVTVSAPGGVEKHAEDTASQGKYFRRSMQVTTALDSSTAAHHLARHHLAVYKEPLTRVETITLVPSTDPALWAAALGMWIGDRVQVKRRTSAGITYTVDGFVERIERECGVQDFVVKVQVSPAAPVQPGIVGDATYGLCGSTFVADY